MLLSKTAAQTPHWPCESPQRNQGRLQVPIDMEPTNTFAEFLREKEKRYRGRNGYGEEQFYIPLRDLKEYWTLRRIRTACDSYSPNIYIRPELIQCHYLRVFSILVHIGMLSYMSTFHDHGMSDNRFPVNGSLSMVLGPLPPSLEAMDSYFQKYQWMFYPVVLDQDELDHTTLSPKRILPLCSEEEIGRRMAAREEAATISKVNFDPSCNRLCEQDDGEPLPTYILKTYHGETNRCHYEHETRAFTRLQNNPSIEHVVKCHATFRQRDTFNLVMEYIPGGDLLQYFRTQLPPQTMDDVINFWDSLTKLVKGLHNIHQIFIEDERSASYQLVHQDIKPDNVLVKPCPGSGLYQFSPIISDLGHSHTRHIDGNVRDAPAVDRRGNQMYCAPESIHHSEFRRTGPNHITSHADIFSAGAVLSDAAAWVAEGQSGRQKYLRLRLQETVGIDGFNNSGYEGAFHNGSGRLTCVGKFHRHIRSTVPSYDKLTPRILEIIEGDMMTATPTNRMPASQLYTLFEIEVRKAKDGCEVSGTLDVERPPSKFGEADGNCSPQSIAARSTTSGGYPDDQERSSTTYSEAPSDISSTVRRSTEVNSRILIPDPIRPEMPPRRPFTTPIVPHQRFSNDKIRSKSVTTARLFMRDAEKYWEDKKKGLQVDAAVEKIIDELISNLHGRDHFFFIDDTKSMEEHSKEIESAFQTLAYIAKRIDPNNLELSFVSKPLDIFEGKHTTPLMKILKQHIGKYTAIEGSIETKLSQLVNKLIMKRLPICLPHFGEISMGRKPITIFVFTDGKWGNGVRKGNGLDQPIRSLMKLIRERGLTRTQVMFQFLRFGHDEDGREHLAHLDEFGKREDCDIVDYRDFDGDVWAMFVAAYTEDNDVNNDTQSPSESSDCPDSASSAHPSTSFPNL